MSLKNIVRSVDSKARSHRRWLGCAEARRPVEIVKKTVAVFVEHAIDIPRISVMPKGPVKSGYKAFQIDVEGN